MQDVCSDHNRGRSVMGLAPTPAEAHRSLRQWWLAWLSTAIRLYAEKDAMIIDWA